MHPTARRLIANTVHRTQEQVLPEAVPSYLKVGRVNVESDIKSIDLSLAPPLLVVKNALTPLAVRISSLLSLLILCFVVSSVQRGNRTINNYIGYVAAV